MHDIQTITKNGKHLALVLQFLFQFLHLLLKYSENFDEE